MGRMERKSGGGNEFPGLKEQECVKRKGGQVRKEKGKDVAVCVEKRKTFGGNEGGDTGAMKGGGKGSGGANGKLGEAEKKKAGKIVKKTYLRKSPRKKTEERGVFSGKGGLGEKWCLNSIGQRGGGEEKCQRANRRTGAQKG